MSNYVHGGTDAREIARLEKQAHWCAPWMLKRFDVPPNGLVLDLASGVGAMAAQLRAMFPHARVVGIDLSESQLRAGLKNHPEVPVARGDAMRMPFADSTFDRVHCSWLLEHVPDPVAVLTEVRRVLKPRGYCHFTEVENSTFRTEPGFPVVEKVMKLLNDAQKKAGGDPFIGRRLDTYFSRAGFSQYEVKPTPIVGDRNDPVYFQGFVDEFAEIFEGLDESLPKERESLAAAAAALRSLPAQNGSIHYTGRIARGWK